MQSMKSHILAEATNDSKLSGNRNANTHHQSHELLLLKMSTLQNSSCLGPHLSMDPLTGWHAGLCWAPNLGLSYHEP